MAIVFAVALIVAAAGEAWAQAAPQPSVETYIDQAVPPGVLPEGMEWNKPLPAGSLVLPRAPKTKPETASLAPPSLPVGAMKAPQINTPTEPPLMSSGEMSSASVMLLEGMKNALQQSGQNLKVPKSQLQPIEASSVPQAPALQAPVASAATVSGVTYQPGRAPRTLDSEAPAQELTSPPETAAPVAATANVEVPKATELEQAPVPLEQAPSQLGSTASAQPESQTTASIFGPAASEPKEEKAGAETQPEAKSSAEPETKVAMAPTPPPSPPPCEPKVTSWIKNCSEAGYAADTSGKITGETRVECPGNTTHDVWLTNSCTPPPAEGAAPRATELKEAPTALAEGAASATPEAGGARVDANCGAANGLAISGKPAADLCLQGIASEVSGEGPWRWSCKGSNGGMTVSCAAPKAIGAPAKEAAKAAAAVKSSPTEDGKCGSSDGVGADTAPSQNLCAKGIASRVNGGGPWTWACSGTNGGQAVACNAPKKVDGACGASDKAGMDTMPQRDLCAAGYASAVTGNGPWQWTCSGLYGGAAATCMASPKVNAVCGMASLKGHHEAPKESLCKAGEASAVEGDGPWRWTCYGAQGGADVTCKGPTIVDGSCGAANGGAFASAPDSDLCALGQASHVTGIGPWNWTCSGLDNGETVSCTASLASKDATASSSAVACGAATETAAFQAPTQNLCAGGKASAMSGNGPWTWSCSDDAGHNLACSTLVATEGSCGTAANVAISQTPSGNLCASGTPGDVTSSKDRANWTWECRGSIGAATVSCSAPILKVESVPPAPKAPEDVKCGAASGRGVAVIPTTDLCAAGKASTVRGIGPWTWTCGAKSGHTAVCEAPKVVDAVCGSANGSIQKATPLSGLCAAGTPTEIDGTGPWLWSCVGVGGGASISCSASAQSQVKIDGACGVAASAVMTTAPAENLCDSGIPSTVYGEGPWTWTCSGLNGGVASNCTTSKVMPKAPLPPGPSLNGNCGPANGVAAIVQPMEGLCSAGTVTSISGNGPWNWNCLGANGGMTVSCTAPLMPPAPIVGVCGAANGVTTMTPPKSGLCSAGISSAVNGKGPWTWSCSGTNGGGAVSCVAPLAGAGGNTGIPSVVTPSTGDVAPAPNAAPVGLVTPRLPAGPLPPLKTGTLPQLTPSKPLNIPPEASALPSADLVGTPAPSVAPDLPPGAEGVTPPPVRDTLKPPPAMMPREVDENGHPIPPGTRLVLDSDISTFSFVRGSDAIDHDAYTALDKLAIVLSNHANSRITLTAYSSVDNISPREARRLSLARALAIRDYLTNAGISSGRIDVRALGANVPSGDMDRVDVKVN
jgi:outer membrane protein OmpA-like peptidoglycan-associated protein